MALQFHGDSTEMCINVHQNTGTRVLIAALFVRAKKLEITQNVHQR